MSNKEIANLLKFFAKLLELYDENIFKIKLYSNTAYTIGKINTSVATLSEKELINNFGIGKNVASKITEISFKNTFDDLEILIKKTPPDVIKMLSIAGLGPKKVQTIWKIHQIETIASLKNACEKKLLEQINGIGEKLQEEIYDYLIFQELSSGKYFFAEVANIAVDLERKLNNLFAPMQISLVGDIRRKNEVVEKIAFLIESENSNEVFEKLNKIEIITKNLKISSPYIWRGNIKNSEIKIEIFTAKKSNYGSIQYLKSASKQHLNEKISDTGTIKALLKSTNFETENQFFYFSKHTLYST